MTSGGHGVDAPLPGTGPMPKRLYLAAVLLILLALAMAGLAFFIYGLAWSTNPYGQFGITNLVGPLAIAAVVAAVLVLRRSGWSPVVASVTVALCVLVSFGGGALGVPSVVLGIAVVAIMLSVPDAFPPRAPIRLEPRTALIAAVAIVVVGGASWWLVTRDPLRQSDVRDVTWAGVVASGEARRLADGRVVGTAPNDDGRLVDGALVVGGGTAEAPTWMARAGRSDEVPPCHRFDAVGYDDGDAVVILYRDYGSQGEARWGLRVAKAPDFTDGGDPDGRYTGAAPDPHRGRTAAVGLHGPLVGAYVGYFCLDDQGRVTRYDRGYGG